MLNNFANDNDKGGAFVIETADVAAGIVVRQADGYRFFAADRQFSQLDGSIFKSPKAAQKAAELMHRAAALDHATGRCFGSSWPKHDGRQLRGTGA